MQSTPVGRSFDSMSNGSPDSIRYSDCDLSMISAEKTVLGTEQSGVNSKHRAAKHEICPSRLQFETTAPMFSNSVIMDSNGFENMEAESFDGRLDVEFLSEISRIRDIRGIRHLDEDHFDQMERDVSVPASQMWGNTVQVPPVSGLAYESSNEPCFTPTGCCVAPWDRSSSSAIMSASPTPLLSRPLKKMHVHNGSEHSIDTAPETNESAIMDREDFTKLFREASNLDFQSHYEYGSLLGRGHFGEVWSVRHSRLVNIYITCCKLMFRMIYLYSGLVNYLL
jgi:hypothetical protein